MAKARFNQETRDFIENLFEHYNYSLDNQISYLEIRERQMYHYECDCPGCTDNSAWDEIIDMLNDRKLQKESDEIMDELVAMDKRFKETGFFTAEDEQFARFIDRSNNDNVD